jgi:hypothetical protein
MQSPVIDRAVELASQPHPAPAAGLRLGELIELVSSVVPEDEVAPTVRALFDSGLASFARLLGPDERAVLRDPPRRRARRPATH